MKKIPVPIDKLFFFFSPLLSLPLVLRGIFYQNKESLVLFCLCIGFISFGFTPAAGYDKSHYINLYKLYQNMPVSDFINIFLQQTTDIVFYALLYFIAYFGLPFEFFSLLITFTTCYLILSVFQKQSVSNNHKKKQTFLYFSIVVLAISLPDLLSGMRNYLSVAFIFYGFHLLVNEKNLKKSAIFLFLGVITHFSSFIYVAVALMYYFFNKRAVVVKTSFVVSLVFIFLPKSFLLDILPMSSMSELYGMKTAGYLSEGSYIENNIMVGNINNLIRHFVNGLWFYIALAFSLLNIKNNNKLFIFFLCLMSFINLISSSPDLLVRYGLLSSIVFLLVLFFDKSLKYSRFFIYLMLIVNVLCFYTNFMVVKKPLVSSLYKVEYMTLPTIFLIDATTSAGAK